MHVLVTGAAGFIGSALSHLLTGKGHTVVGVDSLLHGGESTLGLLGTPSFELVVGDLRDADLRARALKGVDAVVHLAAIVGEPACNRDPETAREVNLEASRKLIEEAVAAGVQRFVFASTCSNYGKMEGSQEPLREDAELRPISTYAETKVAVERLLLEGSWPDEFIPSVVRFSTVHGLAPRPRFDLTVNDFTAQLETDGKLVVFGEQFWRPYVHVWDAARAALLVLEADVDRVRGEVFNVGANGENYRKQDIVDLLLARLPDATVEYVKKDDDPRDYRVNFDKIRETLGFEPTCTVPEGIDEILVALRTGLIRNWKEERYRN